MRSSSKWIFVAALMVMTVFVSANANAGVIVQWADWTSAGAGTVSGTITGASGSTGVTFTGAYWFAQINGLGTTDYWVDAGYTQGNVNRPTSSDVVALAAGGAKTITFSQPVTNPYLAFTSWNGNNVTFSAPFTVISQGCGYWGCGSFQTNSSNTGFYGNGEVHGVLEFTGTFAQLTFTDTSENWHGITVGIADVAAPEPETRTMLFIGFGAVVLVAFFRRPAAI